MEEYPSRSTKIRYSVSVERLIEEVYYSKVREVAREFVGLQKLKEDIFEYEQWIGEQTLKKMYLGFNYLLAESKEDFINTGTVFEDDIYLDENNSLDYISWELLENLFQHFTYALAFYLLDTTDIEGYLDYPSPSITVTKYYVVLTYRN